MSDNSDSDERLEDIPSDDTLGDDDHKSDDSLPPSSDEEKGGDDDDSLAEDKGSDDGMGSDDSLAEKDENDEADKGSDDELGSDDTLADKDEKDEEDKDSDNEMGSDDTLGEDEKSDDSIPPPSDDEVVAVDSDSEDEKKEIEQMGKPLTLADRLRKKEKGEQEPLLDMKIEEKGSDSGSEDDSDPYSEKQKSGSSDDDSVDSVDDQGGVLQDEDAKWDPTTIKLDKNGDFYFKQRNIPTFNAICACLCLTSAFCVFILCPWPWVVPYQWYIPFLGFILCIILGAIGGLALIFSLLKGRSIKTTFSDQTQTITVLQRFLFFSKVTHIDYKEANEFVSLRVGEKHGLSKMVARNIVYLKKMNQEDIPITGKLKFAKEAKRIAWHLNEALISKLGMV